MCDTLVALAAATRRGAALFGKNSDRERNEAQGIERIPAARHAAGDSLRLTYITISQVETTHACLISRPFWMWGAEMGANARGVVIGNEAVHALTPAPRRRALTGMDLVRLGLERAASAAEAVEVITTLLKRHGQGGDCGHLGRFYYHNSFLIADPSEAFVLETVDRWWVVDRVDRTRSISNRLSLGRDRIAASPGLVAHAGAAGWLDTDGRFDFAARLADPARDAVSRGGERGARSAALLEARADDLTTTDIRAILRDHGAAGAAPGWTPEAVEGRTLCMHAGPADRRSQTTASLVSDLRPEGAVHWVTASSAPCLSVFKPVLFAADPPDPGPAATDRFDPATRWWRHEVLHRRVLQSFATDFAAIAAERDRLEATFEARVDDALAWDPGPAALRSLIDDCWREADAMESTWLARALARPAPKSARAYARSWRRLNQAAGLTWPV